MRQVQGVQGSHKASTRDAEMVQETVKGTVWGKVIDRKVKKDIKGGCEAGMRQIGGVCGVLVLTLCKNTWLRTMYEGEPACVILTLLNILHFSS